MKFQRRTNIRSRATPHFIINRGRQLRGYRRTLGLLIEIPSYVAGLIAFLFVLLLMGIMFLLLRTERGKTIPPLNRLGPADRAVFENPLSSSDAPYFAMITLAVFEIVLDVLIIVGALQGMSSTVIGTMLALAAFLAAAILSVYRDAFMSDLLIRKPRLESMAARSFGKGDEGNAHG